ncbi:hypothetical protein JVT61DRAFT_7715 [Boletus reticuloceps]|uniref:Uncharacterized protein n=1 Tax=Boletus reticuloceps TaxID=495285 RepID=A0A8I3A6K5_9AGAM|nr:hypothetical protein JVT61DRAFT_7715 [Boletus reticuloceps]
MEVTDPKGRCNYCNIYAGRDKVKTCSRCRLVSKFAKKPPYSSALQAWYDTAVKNAKWLLGGPTNRGVHPSFEKALPKTQRPMHSTQRSLNGSIIGGLSCTTGRFGPWIWRIIQKTVWPPTGDDNFLVIELERRPNPPNQSLYFKMHGGDIVTRERFLARLRELDELDDEIVASVNERRSNDTAQTIVICEDLIRFLWFSLRDGGASLRQRDPAFSRALAQDWERDLIEAINTGQREYIPISPKQSINLTLSDPCSGIFKRA